MIQGSHRIEYMGGMPRSRGHPALRRFQVRVRMPDAHAHTSRRGLNDHRLRSFQLRCDGHDLDTSTRGFPEFLECPEGWRQDIRRWMNTAPNVANEGSFQMNPQ